MSNLRMVLTSPTESSECKMLPIGMFIDSELYIPELSEYGDIGRTKELEVIEPIMEAPMKSEYNQLLDEFTRLDAEVSKILRDRKKRRAEVATAINKWIGKRKDEIRHEYIQGIKSKYSSYMGARQSGRVDQAMEKQIAASKAEAESMIDAATKTIFACNVDELQTAISIDLEGIEVPICVNFKDLVRLYDNGTYHRFNVHSGLVDVRLTIDNHEYLYPLNFNESRMLLEKLPTFVDESLIRKHSTSDRLMEDYFNVIDQIHAMHDKYGFKLPEKLQ